MKGLVFKVSDNGVGIKPERLRDILSNQGTNGVGLYNINNRLKKLYGKGFHITSSQEYGTEVSWYIIFPYQHDLFSNHITV